MKKGLNTDLRENLAHYQQLGWARKALILLLSVAGAMLVGSLLILAVNADPLEAYYYMLIRPLTSLTSIGEVAMYFTPLLLVGLGVSFTFHAKLSNLGGEGQMRLNEAGEVVDPTEGVAVTGADGPETAGLAEPGD